MTAKSSSPFSSRSARGPGPVLLIGGSGMLGRAWRELLAKQGIECVAPARADLDLTRPQTIDRLITGEHPTVINCSAWTDVDGAEKNADAAAALNAAAIANLAARCGRVHATLVHYSTDYIFTGCGTSPYPVDAPTGPLNVYGQTKLQGELALQRSGTRYLLIRTSWLYAPWAKNFVRTIAGAAKTKPQLKVVSDQRGRPTSSEHLADLTLRLLQQDATGIYHGTDGGQCTWFDFATEIARIVSPACKVEPCTTDEFPRPAKRPAYSVLDLAKTESEIGTMPDWKTNLHSVLSRLE
jgi:dTDP-4-dehydrorhamnose reductase